MMTSVDSRKWTAPPTCRTRIQVMEWKIKINELMLSTRAYRRHQCRTKLGGAASTSTRARRVLSVESLPLRDKKPRATARHIMLLYINNILYMLMNS